MRVIVTPFQVRGTGRVALGVAEFEALFVAGWEPVFRYCLSLTRQTDEAEETTAETFRRAYASWVEGRGPGGQPLAWLFLIARRIVIDRRRRHRLIGWLPLGSRDPAAEDPFRRSELWLWFEQLCRALPERQREVLVLRYHFDLPDEEIGRLMRLSPAGVRTLASRALAALRRQPEVMD
jgi:RNA polymerase sigma-70 factor (ECF subfamily)